MINLLHWFFWGQQGCVYVLAWRDVRSWICVCTSYSRYGMTHGDSYPPPWASSHLVFLQIFWSKAASSFPTPSQPILNLPPFRNRWNWSWNLVWALTNFLFIFSSSHKVLRSMIALIKQGSTGLHSHLDHHRWVRTDADPTKLKWGTEVTLLQFFILKSCYSLTRVEVFMTSSSEFRQFLLKAPPKLRRIKPDKWAINARRYPTRWASSTIQAFEPRASLVLPSLPPTLIAINLSRLH